MDPLSSGQKFSPTLDVDASQLFLPASDPSHVEKKRGHKKPLWAGLGLLIGAGAVALLTGLLVWHFHLRQDVKVKKVYVGALGISGEPYLNEYEDPSSGGFRNMADMVNKQVKQIYAADSVLTRYFTGSTVQAFSEGDGQPDGVVAYYESEFQLPAAQLTSLDEAIRFLEAPVGSQQVQKGRMVLKPSNALSVGTVYSGALDPRLTRTHLSEREPINIHVRKNGHIDSPGFPDSPYPPSLSQKWQLRADPGHRIRLDFHTLVLEDDCQQDFIKIYDSLAPIEPHVLTEQCGYPHGSLSFVSSGSVMLVMLVTSEDKNFPGFRANYSQIPADVAKCGGQLTGDRGSLSSPLFPANYPPKADCTWDIQVPKEKFVKVQFKKFSVGKDGSGCVHDYVEINNQKFCGSKLKTTVFTSQSNTMTIRFSSDRSHVYEGFSADYESFIPTNPCPGTFKCSNNMCIDTTRHCDGFNDCQDNSDEVDCKCEAMQLRCRNDLCKSRFWRCDGVDDCGDNSDEEGCVACSDSQFSCRNSRCISKQLQCDGKDDCGDGSDESKCEKSVRLQCSALTFRCSSGACISKLNPECDGMPDCEDGSDEADCECGRAPFRTSRIVGGQEAREGEWPWQVSLHTRGQGHTCGASVLNDHWLLTAAHCVQDEYAQPSQWHAFLGLHAQGQTNEWTVTRKVRRIVAHPDYNRLSFDSDVALMELDSALPFNQYIFPICLPAPTHHFPPGQEAWITGWGATRDGGVSATVLQKAQVRVINSTECKALLRDELTDRMLCAGILAGGVDACQGDSGGPLTITNPSGRAFVAGVVSWGEGCALRNKPGVYTRITQFRSWIREQSGV